MDDIDVPKQHENYVIKEGEPIVHHGIGNYWCPECTDWVDGLTGRSYIDVISVDISAGTAYVAFVYYVEGEEIVTNTEMPLSKVLGSSVSLPDGPQTPWLRFYYSR